MERQSSDTKNTYKVRSMNTDLESGKKGAAPANIPIDLKKEKDAGITVAAIKNKPQEIRKDFSSPVASTPPKMESLKNSNFNPRPLSPIKPLGSSPQVSLPPIPTNPTPRKELARTPQGPKVALPEKKLPPKKIPSSKSTTKLPPKKIIGLSILAFVIILFIIGEIWWFFIRPNPELAPNPESFFPNPEETIAPEVEKEEPTINPEIPSALLRYNDTIEINLFELSSTELSSGISSAVSGVSGENLLNRIVFISETDKTVLDLSTFLSLSGIIVPESILNNLDSSYDFFFLSENSFDKTTCSKAGLSVDCAGPRLGLALSIKENKDIRSLVRAWEDNLANDIQSILPSQTELSSANFIDANYGGIDIRYQNFPLDTTTIDYAVVNNVLLISTSKTSIYRTIDLSF